MNLLNRKQLPPFGKIEKTIDHIKLRDYCVEHGYTNYAMYNDVKYSTTSKYKSFLDTHEFCKNSFFKEESAESKEGELYKQLYLTEIEEKNLTSSVEQINDSSKTIFSRVRRALKDSSNYIPEADELNYTFKNKHCSGVLEEVINIFSSKVTRARLAVLMPNFKIKPHVDYDPSYITRYHIPIITNENIIFGVKTKQGDVEFKMPADGSIYFFNSGLLHWVKNLSDQPRLHLIVDTHGQSDLNFTN